MRPLPPTEADWVDRIESAFLDHVAASAWRAAGLFLVYDALLFLFLWLSP